MDKLIDEVLAWWEEHQHDCGAYYNGDYDEDYNIYNEEPKFVTIAKSLKEKDKK